MAYAPAFEETMKTIDPLQYKMFTRRDVVSHEDPFALDARGRYSPSVNQNIGDIMDATVKGLREVEDRIPDYPFPEPE